MHDWITVDEAWCLAAIWLITHGGTHYLKTICRKYGCLTDSWSPRAISVLVAMIASAWIWPPGGHLSGWQIGAAIGFGWPTIYALGRAFARRRERDLDGPDEYDGIG